jgi:hypothetical protein
MNEFKNLTNVVIEKLGKLVHKTCILKRMETHKLLRIFGSTKRPKDISRITLVVMIEGSCLVYVVCVCLSVIVESLHLNVKDEF